MADDERDDPTVIVIEIPICESCAAELARPKSREEQLDLASDAAKRRREMMKDRLYRDRN